MTSATRTTVTAKIPGLTGGDYTLLVKRSVMELNEARTPYGRIELTVALPASAVLAQISPYASLRIQGTINHSWVTPVRASQTRTFDFILHERTIDHGAGTLTLVGQTDEAMLIDRMNVSNTLARTYGLSLKTAVDYALTQIGATLEAGAVDATLTSKALEPVVTNLDTNPSFEAASTGYTNVAGTLNTKSTTQAHSGTASMALSATSTFDSAASKAFVVTSGAKYVISGWVYLTNATANSLGRGLYVRDGAGNDVNANYDRSKLNQWQRVSLTYTAAVTNMEVRWYSDPSAIVYIDDVMVTLGTTLYEWFSGASTSPGLYAFAWTGTANASSSTKTNLPNTDATIWQPGQTLDRWLAPILQASNRRLFCDEHRKWRLVDSTYSIDGTLVVSEGFNAKSGADRMSRQKTEQGVPTWFDHVAVHYSWKDATGVSQEMWDFASSGSVKGYLVEVTTPWPGPGAAAGILSRAIGRGRTQDITALTDYVATPGMAIVTTLPGTPTQSGVLSSIAWRWDEGADDMTVTSRGLTNTPSNAWIFAVGAWSAATGSWAAATGTN